MPYKATRRNKKYLRLYKQGKSIGFTMRSSLKAKGLIPRANGTYKVSNKYQGGAWPWSSSPTKLQQAQTAASNATQRAVYNTARSKSRVANVLGQKALNKGNVIYTNKERIASELETKLVNIGAQYKVDINTLKNDVKHAALSPKSVIDTLKGLIAQLKPQVGDGRDAEQKPIIIKISFGFAKLTLNVLRYALYIAITFTLVAASAQDIVRFNPFAAYGILPEGRLKRTMNNWDVDGEITEEIERLNEFLSNGTMTEEEYKERLAELWARVEARVQRRRDKGLLTEEQYKERLAKLMKRERMQEKVDLYRRRDKGSLTEEQYKEQLAKLWVRAKADLQRRRDEGLLTEEQYKERVAILVILSKEGTKVPYVNNPML
uniref:SHOCT domain-containing protein n=1 Tax=viral metagenome TaxID=1070528 RepID=A0A6C0IB87_9ZZZZ